MPAPAHMIVGRVRNAHGIRGEVVVESLTSEPDARFAVGRRVLSGTITGELSPPDTPGPHTLTIRRSKPFKGGWILRLEELADRNAADLWRGRYLFVPTDEIDPPASDEVYFHDLVGLRVERSGGDPLGRVEALHEMPQGLVLEVSTKAGIVMLPYRPEVVSTVDLGRRAMVVQVPEGLMDEDVAEDRDAPEPDTSEPDTPEANVPHGNTGDRDTEDAG